MWLVAVLNATEENLRLGITGISALLGADGEPESFPDVLKPPSLNAIEGARELAQIDRQDPTRQMPNPDPAFGATLPASNAVTVAAGALRLCVQNADGAHHPGWGRALVSLR